MATTASTERTELCAYELSWESSRLCGATASWALRA